MDVSSDRTPVKRRGPRNRGAYAAGPGKDAHLQARRGADRVFDALSEPTRREILWLLAERGALPVSRIVDSFECISQPNVSYHVRILREAGLVVSAKNGREVLCEVDQRAVRELLGYLDRTFLRPLERARGRTVV